MRKKLYGMLFALAGLFMGFNWHDWIIAAVILVLGIVAIRHYIDD